MAGKPLTEKWKNPTDKPVKFTLGGVFDSKSVEFAREYVVEPGEEIEVPTDLSYGIKNKPWKDEKGQEHWAGVAPQLERVDPAPSPAKGAPTVPAKK